MAHPRDEGTRNSATAGAVAAAAVVAVLLVVRQAAVAGEGAVVITEVGAGEGAEAGAETGAEVGAEAEAEAEVMAGAGVVITPAATTITSGGSSSRPGSCRIARERIRTVPCLTSATLRKS